jgi:hypothetical protein
MPRYQVLGRTPPSRTGKGVARDVDGDKRAGHHCVDRLEEPLALIHAPNESVDPREIESMALTEALFLQGYTAARR